MAKVYKAEKVLRFIASAPEGKRACEIQEFICQLNGMDWNEKEDLAYFNKYHINSGRSRGRKHRGIWAVNLWCSYSAGLLYRFCAKRNGRWVVVRPIPSKNFYSETLSPRICRSDLTKTWRSQALPTASELGLMS